MAAYDPVVIFDVMWEAANRLAGHYAALTDDDEAVRHIRLIWDYRESIPVDDIDGQRRATQLFADLYRRLRDGDRFDLATELSR